MRDMKMILLAVCIGQLTGCRSYKLLPPPFRAQVTDHEDAWQVVDAAVDADIDADIHVVESRVVDIDAGLPRLQAREQPAASSAFPRLSHHQWAVAAQQLLHLDSLPDVSHLIKDPATATGFDSMGGSLDVSPDLWKGYQVASERVAQDVAAAPEKIKRIGLESAPAANDDLTIARFVSLLTERAFRHPPEQAELQRYVDLFHRAKSLLPERDPISAGTELVIAAILQSPSFVYRAETANAPDDNGQVKLSEHEIAARLSFMLWDGLPDSELIDAALRGELQTSDGIANQVQRLLASPLAADKLTAFHRQWLHLDSYKAVRDTEVEMPDENAAHLGAALYSETERFVRDVAYEHDGSFTDLLLADFTYVNQYNAPLYGLSGAYGSGLQRVSLNTTQRLGLLTQVGFLASHAGATAPILRGAFIVKRVLCATLPPPPIFDPPQLQGRTRREQINSITGPGTCGAGCHATLINPAGYPFEYFDDMGRHRSSDSGEAIDGSASYSFQAGTVSYDGPTEWIEKLAQSREAHACYSRQWLEYAYGRVATEGDAPLLERMATASRRDHVSIKQLLVMLVQSPNFSTKQLETQ